MPLQDFRPRQFKAFYYDGTWESAQEAALLFPDHIRVLKIDDGRGELVVHGHYGFLKFIRNGEEFVSDWRNYIHSYLHLDKDNAICFMSKPKFEALYEVIP
jgi:hypothetical protein